MKTAISIRMAQQLYWLGRYLQRSETTIREVLRSYDYVIDRDKEDGKKLYAKLGIDLHYTHAKDFLYQALYGTHPASILAMIGSARENGIEIRNLLDERGFGALNGLYNRIKENQTSELTPFFLEEILDTIRLLLGTFFSDLYRPKSYHFIRLGQIVERMDLVLRLFGEMEMIMLDVVQLNTIIRKLHKEAPELHIRYSDTQRALREINEVIEGVIAR